MARSNEKDGIRRRGGALFGELRRLDLMHENGKLSDEAYRNARARVMRSVSDADVVMEAAKLEATAPVTSRIGAGALLAVGAVALAAIALAGATPEALTWISVMGLATAALAACWEV